MRHRATRITASDQPRHKSIGDVLTAGHRSPALEALMVRVPPMLWIDCSAAATVGAVVLLAQHALSQWHQLPLELIQFLGIVNLSYASGAFMLARARNRPRWAVLALVVANAGWAVVCLALALGVHRQASWLGTTHLVAEALIVACLAAVEWRQRHTLAT